VPTIFLSNPSKPPNRARCRALIAALRHGASSGIIKLIDESGSRGLSAPCIDDAEVELDAREWPGVECLVRRIG